MAAFSLNFAGLAEYVPVFEHGLALTAVTAAIVTLGGVALGIAGGVIRYAGPGESLPRKLLYGFWTCYVEAIRNTPFIIQLFFIFFGFPQLGLQLSANVAAVAALILNLGAYVTEIVRSGLGTTPKGQWEACRVLGLSRAQAYVRVVHPPALARVYPALVSQCVLVMLGSAVISQISVEDLTYAANWVQSLTFLSFECYLVATILYLALAVVMRRLMLFAGRFLFRGGV